MQVRCPHCQNSDEKLIEWLRQEGSSVFALCVCCSKVFEVLVGEKRKSRVVNLLRRNEQ